MDIEIIKPFLKYTISLFKDMYNFSPAYSKARLVKSLDDQNWDISGVVGIIGAYEGIFTIRFKRSTAFKLLNHANMLEDDSKAITHMITEMVAEFANIICGNALNISREDINITVPFTVQGSKHTIAWPAKGYIIAIPFNTPYGPFEIQINIAS